MLRYIPHICAMALLLNWQHFHFDIPFPVIIVGWVLVIYVGATTLRSESCSTGRDDLRNRQQERAPLMFQESAKLSGTQQPGRFEPAWVREHRPMTSTAEFPLWHWFSCGWTDSAACGAKPVSGSPLISRQRPQVLIDSNMCPECYQQWLEAIAKDLENA